MKPNIMQFFALCLVLFQSACTVVETKQNPIDKLKAAEINVKLGAAYIQEGLLNAANEKLEKALDLNPKNAQAHNVYGMLNYQLGLTDKANKHFKKSMSLDSDNSEFKNNYGSFLCQQGKVEQAEVLFKEALSDPLYSTPEYAWANAGACMLNIPDFEKADNYLRNALRRQPQLPSALFQSAKLQYLKGEYAVSKNYLDRYFKVANKNAESLWLGLRLAWKLRDQKTVESYALLLKNQFPDSNETRKLIKAEAARSVTPR